MYKYFFSFSPSISCTEPRNFCIRKDHKKREIDRKILFYYNNP